MKIRRSRSGKRLKTHLETATIVGGESDLAEYAVGFCVGGKGLTSTRRFARYNSDAQLSLIESIDYFDNIKSGIAVTTNGQVYRWKDRADGAAFTYSGMTGTYLHSAFKCVNNGEPAVCVVSGPRMTLVTESGYLHKNIPFEIKGACMHMGRVFAADAKQKYVVRWSGTPTTDWRISPLGSGYISLDPVRGEIYRLVSMGDKLCVYRELGVDIIKAYGDPRHFAVEHNGSGNVTERLTESACAACGDKLYFCSEKNVYRFDGEKIERVEIPEYMKGRNYRLGKAFEGRYVDFYCEDGQKGESYHFEIDTLEQTFAFYARNLPFIWKTPSHFFAWQDNAVYREDDSATDTDGIWTTDYLDAGDDYVKLLKSIYLEGSGDIEVGVAANGVTPVFKGKGRIPVNIGGSSFRFSISGNGKVDKLVAEWEVRG